MRPEIGVPVLEGFLVRLEPLAARHAGDLAVAAEKDRSSYGFTLVPCRNPPFDRVAGLGRAGGWGIAGRPPVSQPPGCKRDSSQSSRVRAARRATDVPGIMLSKACAPSAKTCRSVGTPATISRRA
jgi:hypothetical protein